MVFTDRVPIRDKELESFNGIRVLALNSIILGSTFFYMLKGPLQNLDVIQEFMGHFSFSFVLAADLIVDIFFWLTAFLSSYFLLVRLKSNYG